MCLFSEADQSQKNTGAVRLSPACAHTVALRHAFTLRDRIGAMVCVRSLFSHDKRIYLLI